MIYIITKMAKKNTAFSAEKFGIPKSENASSNPTFYFGKENFKWMLIGLVLIVAGFILMMGADANTVDGVYNPEVWNEGIFSFRRIRLAPLLVIAGFAVQVYAILKRNKK